MAYIWTINKSSDAQWLHHDLAGNLFQLGPNHSLLMLNKIADGLPGVSILQKVTTSGLSDKWLLLRQPDSGFNKNGCQLKTSVTTLRNRDYLHIHGSGFYFTTEVPATILPFSAEDQETHCPRCKTKVDPQQPSVRCPSCSLVYHQDQKNKLLCYTYAETCCCGHKTDLDGEFSWTPDQL